MHNPPNSVVSGQPRLQRPVVRTALWMLFFLISAGLGYPTLNRYDPRQVSSDSAIYSKIAISGPRSVETNIRFRVLVPYLARAVLAVANKHTGTWDPLMLSFLVVNAAFVATTALMIFEVANVLLRNRSVALLGSTLFLLNFAIANMQLAALVDSAECCLFMAAVTTLFFKHWHILPIIGIAGVLAKESFLPFSMVMTIGWLLMSRDDSMRRPAFWICGMAFAEMISSTIVQSYVSGHFVSILSFALAMKSPAGFGHNLLRSFADKQLWYVLGWLLPLGVAGLRQTPLAWRISAGATALTAVLLNAYHSGVGGGGADLGRYIFNVAGPLLSVSAAAFLSGPGKSFPQTAID